MEKLDIFIVILSFILFILNLIHDVFYRTVTIDLDKSFLKLLLILVSFIVLIFGLSGLNYTDNKWLNLFLITCVLILFFYKDFFGKYTKDNMISKVLQVMYYIINCLVFSYVILCYLLNGAAISCSFF